MYVVVYSQASSCAFSSVFWPDARVSYHKAVSMLAMGDVLFECAINLIATTSFPGGSRLSLCHNSSSLSTYSCEAYEQLYGILHKYESVAHVFEDIKIKLNQRQSP